MNTIREPAEQLSTAIAGMQDHMELQRHRDHGLAGHSETRVLLEAHRPSVEWVCGLRRSAHESGGVLRQDPRYDVLRKVHVLQMRPPACATPQGDPPIL
jgi:hypothetical protein